MYLNFECKNFSKRFLHPLGKILKLQIKLPKTVPNQTASMVDDLNGRGPQSKTTSMEDNLNRRRPPLKTTLMEDDLNGIQQQQKTTSMKDDLNGKRPQ